MSDMPEEYWNVLRKKLERHEETPDDELWLRVKTTAQNSWVDRLQQLEEMPDDAVWTRVEKRVRHVSGIRRFSQAAAILLALLILTHSSTSPANLTIARRHQGRERQVSPFSLKNDVNSLGEVRISDVACLEDSVLIKEDLIPRSTSISSLKSLAKGSIKKKSSFQIQDKGVDASLLRSTLQVGRVPIEANVFSPILPEDHKSSKIRRDVKLIFLYSPVIENHHIVPVGGDGVYIGGIRRTPFFSKQRLNTRFDVAIEKYVAKRLVVQGGVFYQRVNQHLTYWYTTPEASDLLKSPDNQGYMLVPRQQHASSYRVYNELGGTLSVGYSLSSGRFSWLTGMRLEVHKKATIDSAPNLYSVIFCRVSYQLRNVGIIVQPSYAQASNYDQWTASQEASGGLYSRPSQGSISIGLSYRFREKN